MKVSRLSTVAVAGLVFLTGLSAAHAALPQAVGDTQLPSLAPMVKQASPAVVNIAVRQKAPQFNSRRGVPLFPQLPARPRGGRTGSGSGVIVDAKNGYIMTNHHVVEQAESITVTLYDDRTMEATVIGSDPGSDVALIQVDGDNLAQIPLSDSDALEVGDFVVAIGNPFGLSNTVTSGIVSGLGRYGLSSDGYEDFIQTDAAINPGNSGGALLNLRGELIGINTAIKTTSGGNVGIGFAVPINMARRVMEQILEFGEVRRGLLGVRIGRTLDLNDETRERLDLGGREGAIVLQVDPDSAADKAGIEIEDVIVMVNGEKTRDAQELRNTIGLLSEGDQVTVDVIRGGRDRAFKARLGSQATDTNTERLNAGDTLHPGLEGASFGDLNKRQRKTLNSGKAGVLVTEVAANSAAEFAGLEEGDIITTVNLAPVSNLAEFRDKASADASRLMLRIVRDGASTLVIVG
ncbi:MAG: Do family serine endopeptidase [Gammaproteobacteria bacterium]